MKFTLEPTEGVGLESLTDDHAAFDPNGATFVAISNRSAKGGKAPIKQLYKAGEGVKISAAGCFSDLTYNQTIYDEQVIYLYEKYVRPTATRPIGLHVNVAQLAITPPKVKDLGEICKLAQKFDPHFNIFKGFPLVSINAEHDLQVDTVQSVRIAPTGDWVFVAHDDVQARTDQLVEAKAKELEYVDKSLVDDKPTLVALMWRATCYEQALEMYNIVKELETGTTATALSFLAVGLEKSTLDLLIQGAELRTMMTLQRMPTRADVVGACVKLGMLPAY